MFAKTKLIFGEINKIFLGGDLTSDLSICAMGQSDFIVCRLMENYLGLKRVK